MLAELLNIERGEGILHELLESYPFKPYIWALGKERQTAANQYLLAQIAQVINNGGIARAYCLDNKLVGLCTISPDELATKEIRRRTYRLSHLIALGKSPMESIVKQALIRETLRQLPKNACVVASCPSADISTINVLQQCGFVTTHTALILARDLSNADWLTTPVENYEVHTIKAEELEQFDDDLLDIPRGFLGWDERLPPETRSRVYKDWLRTYALDNSKLSQEVPQLLVASNHQGQVVGLLAEKAKTETGKIFGFGIGKIELITTTSEYRSNGVATTLVKNALHSFAQNGIRVTEMVLNAADTANINNYQEMGFSIVGAYVTMVKGGAP